LDAQLDARFGATSGWVEPERHLSEAIAFASADRERLTASSTRQTHQPGRRAARPRLRWKRDARGFWVLAQV